jgi:hypothetical protein
LGETDRDLAFVRGLMSKHKLKSVIDLTNREYLLWKTKPLPAPAWNAVG